MDALQQEYLNARTPPAMNPGVPIGDMNERQLRLAKDTGPILDERYAPIYTVSDSPWEIYFA